MRNTRTYRLRLIIRDANKITTALENLHRGVVKLEDRAEKIDAKWTQDWLHHTAILMGQALGRLDALTNTGGNCG